MRNQNTLIADEGKKLILFLFMMAGGLFVAKWINPEYDFQIEGGVFFLFALFTMYFFRNPTRRIDGDEKSVVAPADGRIIKINECFEDELLNDKAIQISIFMNVFNVHINRVPVSGSVQKLKYHPGKFFRANLDKASKENEHCSILIKTASGALVQVVQIAGLIARRIVFYPGVGDFLEKGKRFGLIRFGSRLDVYMPVGSDISAKIGQKIKAGEVLGYLK